MIAGILSGLWLVLGAVIRVIIEVTPVIIKGILWCLQAVFVAVIWVAPIVVRVGRWFLRSVLVVINWAFGVVIATIIDGVYSYLKAILGRAPRRPRWAVGYTLRCQRDQVLYIGITNNPQARESAHRSDGKVFDHLNVETEPMYRDDARKWEARSLASHRKRFGGNPFYNLTDQG